MEHGFGVAGMNRSTRISSDGTACYSGGYSWSQDAYGCGGTVPVTGRGVMRIFTEA